MKISQNDLDVVILAGGRGTRLSSVVSDRPKPLADINGKPFLFWLLSYLEKQGIRRVILSLGHMADLIEDYFLKNSMAKLELIFSKESEPLGTGGGLRQALSKINSEEVLVLNGDSFCLFSVDDLVKNFSQFKAQMVMGLIETLDCGRYGSVVINNKKQVTQFLEKSALVQGGLINAGVYLLKRSLIEQIPHDQAVSLERDIFPKYVGKGFYGIEIKSVFIDIGTPESLILAREMFGQGKFG